MQQQYGDFIASELFCPKCQRATPVRERILLALPDGDLYEYRCAVCSTSVGERKVKMPVSLKASLPSQRR